MFFNKFSSIYKLTDKTCHRESSWDQRGMNRDYVHIGRHKIKVLADIEGPGIIKHLYFTTILQSPLDFRRCIIRMYWDHEENPSVEVPLGDFFGVSNCKVREIKSLMITINRGIMGSYGFNVHFPMPFSKHAKITLENQGPVMLGGAIRAFWYHIDYEKVKEPWPDNTAYFHAQYNQEKITKVTQDVPDKKKNMQIWNGKNLTGKDNYVILDAEGDGQLAGLLLTVNNIAGGWYGEGDDMIFIDDDSWPPSIHGTGSEEIFGGGACPKEEYNTPYHGFHIIESPFYSGYNGMYRWYIQDPIRFKKRLRWTIEHGHANNFENEYNSVAYWYQKEPHKKFSPMPKLKDRLPKKPKKYKRLWMLVMYKTLKSALLLTKYTSKAKEELDRLFQDAVSDFMAGKYELAREKLKKVKRKNIHRSIKNQQA